MVSQDTTSNPNSSILHHFLISSSNPINSEAQDFNPYGSVLRPNNTCPEETLGGVFPTIQGGESELGVHSRYVMDLFGAPNDANRLALSLGSQGLVVPPLHYKHNYFVPSAEQTCNNEGIGYMGGDYSFVGTIPFAPFSSPSYSRYLRPAQLLLEEVANFGGMALEPSDLRRLFLSGSKGASSSELKAELLSLSCSSSAEKHVVQIKISDLIALLEQVERRYEEYCKRMEEVVSSFEVIAGEGVARNYTALALQAMCRHFCSLREAILAQIKAAMKKLCPELPKINTGLLQLSLFDRETRQNRLTLQQLGLMQQCQKQMWRPIRGLPETSVAILRAWLFEHFLNPYPNDSEKLMLASQTGLTKNQVSNWFINARVRFWKPMIEEMYREEFGESSSPGDSELFFSSSCGSTTREACHDPVADD